MRLENAGVLMIDDIGVDTYSDERFYSYRRSVHRKETDYGRHVHAIALEPSLRPECFKSTKFRIRPMQCAASRCGFPALDLNAF